jgi:hypothetical protein
LQIRSCIQSLADGCCPAWEPFWEPNCRLPVWLGLHAVATVRSHQTWSYLTESCRSWRGWTRSSSRSTAGEPPPKPLDDRSSTGVRGSGEGRGNCWASTWRRSHSWSSQRRCLAFSAPGSTVSTPASAGSLRRECEPATMWLVSWPAMIGRCACRF